MTAGIPLAPDQVSAILTRLRRGVESHQQIAADQGLARHTVHRIARIYGIPNRNRRSERLPTPPIRGDDSWMEEAACGGVFGFTELPVAEQRGWCDGCRVRDQCLTFGLNGPTPTVHWDKGHGPVHGGVSASDLRKLRKLQNQTADLRKQRVEMAS